MTVETFAGCRFRIVPPLLALLLALTSRLSAQVVPSLPATPATPPAASSPDPADPEQALSEALSLERRRQWADAIRVYERALERWPARVELRHRLRLCEAHIRLARRYQDPSFRQILLRMPANQALDLFDEVLERIETHYVDPVSPLPLVRRGLDNLEVALREPLFLDTNAPGADPARVLWLRQTLQNRRHRLLVHSREEARRFVSEAVELGRRAIQLEPTALILEFVYGACDALDDYSAYLSPDKLDDLYSVIDGNFVGLGVELKSDPAGLLLVGIIPGGPAAAAGLTVGQRIVAIDGREIRGLALDEAAALLQGPEGSAVEISILAPDGSRQTLRLVRRPIEVLSVSQARILDPVLGIGYIQLTGFQKGSTEELRRALSALEQAGMRFLLLDLRGNPGGLLDVSVEIADEFLDSGIIVSTRGRAGSQNAVYRARPGVSWRLPVAVLVDHDTASAGEILAGALKENRRALVIGEKSYGKGSVQSIFPLRTAPAGLKLTTARFYSPTNQSYSEQGVLPDVAVRTAARPATDSASDPLPSSFGDPATDTVLQRALAQARRVLSVAH
ncbi:MAG: carboxyl-terminal processing protease [Isosphaeraceae bacterium]|jgi:carboxyl-terminal processing protease|nr:MAG: carboxyl-terminal processing protease [Isosphaeraceae bacterium]